MFKDISAEALLSRLSEEDLSKTTKEISDNFTKDRSKIEKYVNSEDFVTAYTWFYLPTNKFKLGHLFSQLPAEIVEEITTRPFIDYGCGPGTYTWALLDYVAHIGSSFNQDIYLVDTSKQMLRQARRIHAVEYSHHEIINYFSQIPPRSIEGPTLFFGNSINEMGLEKTLKVIRENNPDIIVYIEPGTKDFFKTALSIRESLIEQGYSIAYPCPNHSPCPAKIENDWCHQVTLPEYPESIHRKCQLTGLDRRSLPMTAHVYTKSGLYEKDEKIATLYRYLGETKGTITFTACIENRLVKVEIQKRGHSKKRVKEILKIPTGTKFTFEIEKKISDRHFRISDIIMTSS